MSEVLEREVRSIMESIAVILSDQRDSIGDLPEGEQLLIRLCASAIRDMIAVPVDSDEDPQYLERVADAFQDSFTTHKDKWVDVLAMNQTKVLGLMTEGMI